jgi:hypothetical protein
MRNSEIENAEEILPLNTTCVNMNNSSRTMQGKMYGEDSNTF